MTVEQMREWRRLHPERLREQRRETKRRHNEESLEFADRNRMPWDSTDFDYLEEHAKDITARNMAFNLGRSYAAIMMKAFRLKIPMMTEAKRHGQLVTNRPKGGDAKQKIPKSDHKVSINRL